MIQFTEKDGLYLQLAAKGLSDSAIAKELNVPLGTIQGQAGYKARILNKTGLSTKEQIVKYAKQNGYGETKDVKADYLSNILRGFAMEPVRDFYRHLEKHYLSNDCAGCKAYHKYDVLLVYGNLHNHLELFTTPDKDVRALLYHLEQRKFVQLEYEDGLTRMYFRRLQGGQDS